MTKTPGEFEPPKPITKAERDARKAFRRVDAETAMTEHEIAQGAFSANRERLKAKRLAREAAGPPAAAKDASRAVSGRRTVGPRARVHAASKREGGFAFSAPGYFRSSITFAVEPVA